MSSIKKDGNAVAWDTCWQMVRRLEEQGCEIENCSGTWCIQTPAGAELHLSAYYIDTPQVRCAYWNHDNNGDRDDVVKLPYDADLDQFCGWAMAL